MKRRVVVTGLGAICSLGQDRETIWQNILAGKSGITTMTNIDPANLKVKIAGEVKDFRPETKFDPKELKRMDRVVQFAMWASHEAIQDAGLDFEKIDRTRTGVIIGSGIGGIAVWESEHTKFIQQGPGRVSPFLIPMMISDMTSGMVSIHWKLGGPNFTVTSACASGAHSIGESYRLIAYGDAEVIITGGAEAPITMFAVSGFANMRALSQRNDEPQKASRPFDKDRDGFVIGEGSAIIVVEELEHALHRGARIYGEIIGYGMSGDGFHITAPAPGGEGAYRAMKQALADNNTPLTEVNYINAHGTSTELNDRYEVLAIKNLFGDHAKQIAINSTKSMTGHLLGAAGAIELTVTLLSIRDGIVHQSVNLDEVEAGFDLDFVRGGPRKLEVKVAVSNSFGFGGHNAVLAVRRFDKK